MVRALVLVRDWSRKKSNLSKNCNHNSAYRSTHGTYNFRSGLESVVRALVQAEWALVQVVRALVQDWSRKQSNLSTNCSRSTAYRSTLGTHKLSLGLGSAVRALV